VCKGPEAMGGGSKTVMQQEQRIRE
jgi:hypothetical protein